MPETTEISEASIIATTTVTGIDGEEHGHDHDSDNDVGHDHDHSGHDDHGAHADHGFDIGNSILSHNMPYASWEPIHGSPIIVFDLGLHSAMNYDALVGKAQSFDGSEYTAWATDVAAKKDFRYDQSHLDVGQLSQVMAMVQHDAPVVFPRSMSWMNTQIFWGTAALLLMVLLFGVIFRRDPKQVQAKGRVQNFMEVMVVYLRDEVIRPAISHHADAFVPFLVSAFFIILSVNLFGLIPGTGTMSGNIGVTAAWAFVIFCSMLFFGMKEQGPKFWLNIVPIPFTLVMSPVWFLLLIIELMGLVIKPIALAIRLFANMFAGHTVLLVFLSLGYIILAQDPEAVGLAATLKIVGFVFAIAFHAMEVLVAFIQAYVFTMLAAMFIGMSIHPEH